MQLYALDSKHNLVAATKALKQHDYICLECQGVVRIRSGIHRHAHFFHLRPPISCKLNAKSMIHLQTQYHLQKILPTGESFLEKRFPSINRIADVAWPNQKLIFEIQYSPISIEEIHARNKDYASLGYQVIWILHEHQFNQYRLSGAELALRCSPYFFTDMDSEGQGTIYDQFDIYNRGQRIKKLRKLPVDLSKPSTPPEIIEAAIPKMLEERIHSWPLHFDGDLIDHAAYFSDYLEAALKAERDAFPAVPEKTFIFYINHWISHFILRPYKLIFQLLLERACK